MSIYTELSPDAGRWPISSNLSHGGGKADSIFIKRQYTKFSD